MREAIKIVGISVLGFVTYGIAQDQITARISIEYFTIGHVRLVATDNPTVHALLWGVIATWWFGAGAGIVFALVSRIGKYPKLIWHDLLHPAGWLFLATGSVAFIAGFIGYSTSEAGIFYLVEPYASQIAPERHTRFLANGWAHTGAYIAGGIGSVMMVWWLWKERKRRAHLS
ncbi:MAG: hypothetical protein AAFN11_13430 [Chloroflexota bacterium]